MARLQDFAAFLGGPWAHCTTVTTVAKALRHPNLHCGDWRLEVAIPSILRLCGVHLAPSKQDITSTRSFGACHLGQSLSAASSGANLLSPKMTWDMEKTWKTLILFKNVRYDSTAIELQLFVALWIKTCSTHPGPVAGYAFLRFVNVSFFSWTNRRTKLSKVLFVVLHVMFYCIELSEWLSVARRFSSARIELMPEKHAEPWAPPCVSLKALNTFFLSLNRFCQRIMFATPPSRTCRRYNYRTYSNAVAYLRWVRTCCLPGSPKNFTQLLCFSFLASNIVSSESCQRKQP